MNSLCSEQPPLPIRPRPLDDELLSSWLIRLAHAHGYKVETLCRMLFGRGHSLWCCDVDALPGQEMLQALSRATGVSCERVRATTLGPLIQNLGPSCAQPGTNPWLLPLGIYHRTRRRAGLMFCPQCLRQGQPYFRRMWRLASVTVCLVHGSNLVERCGHCDAVLAPHRTDLRPDGLVPGEGILASCWRCGLALASSPTSAAASELLMLTGHFQDVLQRGYLARESNPSLYSHLYFQGVRRIAAALHLAEGDRQFEWSTLAQRQRTLARLAGCLLDPGQGLAQRLKAQGLRYCDVKPTRGEPLPYWLACELWPMARSQASNRGLGEAASAARALQSAEQRFQHSRSRLRFGFDLPRKYLPADLVASVTEDAYERLIVWLEQRFACTGDPLLRLALLQDKVLFILLRCGPWTAQDLSQLTWDAVEVRGTPPEPLETWSTFTAPDAARAWLWWHHTQWRPKLAGCTHSPAEFVSPHTGRGLSPSGICERFRRAVDGAMLGARIPSLTSFKTRSGQNGEHPELVRLATEQEASLETPIG